MRVLNRLAIAAVVSAGALGLMPAAHADTLSLTTSWYADAAGVQHLSPASTGTFTSVSATNGYTYGQVVSDSSGHAFSDTPLYGFDDSYAFSLTGPASANSLTATINLGSLFEIQNLSVRLFSYTGSAPIGRAGQTGLPAGGQPPVIDAWTPVPTGTGWVTVFSNENLTAGNYVLEIRGLGTGSAGGTYSGLLQVGPVPLPAALPLMLSGLGLLGTGGWLKRRRDFLSRRRFASAIHGFSAHIPAWLATCVPTTTLAIAA